MDRVIPPFYACYLLRSTVRHQNLYVGSTPNPVRRLRQHNGLAKGGAVRTSRDSLRPWEMTCLVTGFPSKIAALQFEWAWQNTHQTRHIAVEERITQAQQRTRISPKTGRTRKRTGRPRVSLTDKLSNLHILLRANSFERWPLEVKFFAKDVFKMWERCTAKITGDIRSGIRVALDESALSETSDTDSSRSVGINALDVTFQPMKAQAEKSRMVVDGHCAVCHQSTQHQNSLVLVCVAKGCNSTSHLDCLSTHFLAAEEHSDSMIPTEGDCPTCGSTLQWTDLVKDLSLRIRGEKEVAALFKERKLRKKASASHLTDSVVLDDSASEDEMVGDSDIDLEHPDLVVPSELQEADQVLSQEDEWLDVDSILTEPATSISKQPRRKIMSKKKAKPSGEIVIEDSDWDEAEVIE